LWQYCGNGIVGPTGATGIQGVKGDSGSTGLQGSIGLTGLTGAIGIQGLKGDSGAIGPQGSIGFTGSTGSNGIQGLKGDSGAIGPQGSIGLTGLTGATGTQGIKGDSGATGAQGLIGVTGTILQFAMFYGLTAGTGNSIGTDYAATVAVKTTVGTGRVTFPRNGPATGITRLDNTSFTLPSIGTYEIIFHVNTTEPGQLQLELNNVDLPETVAVNMNPTAGGHPIMGNFFITTTSVNSILAVINPIGNTPALTITPANGANTHANTQSITIKKIN
jgi:hypothetical protein